MFCPNCGSKLEDNAAFCPSCGAPVKAASANAATDNAAPNNAAADSSAQNTWQEAPIAAPARAEFGPLAQQNAGEATVTNGTNPPDYLTINIVLTVVSVFVCCFSCLSIAALVTGIIGIVMSTAGALRHPGAQLRPGRAEEQGRQEHVDRHGRDPRRLRPAGPAADRHRLHDRLHGRVLQRTVLIFPCASSHLPASAARCASSPGRSSRRLPHLRPMCTSTTPSRAASRCAPSTR